MQLFSGFTHGVSSDVLQLSGIERRRKYLKRLLLAASALLQHLIESSTEWLLHHLPFLVLLSLICNLNEWVYHSRLLQDWLHRRPQDISLLD